MAKKAHVPAYSHDYYRFQALIKDPAFQKRVRWLYSRYKKFDCPVPRTGFSTYEEYRAWIKQVFDKIVEIEKTGRQQRVKVVHRQKIIGDRLRFQIKQDVDMTDPLFPPVPGQFVEEALAEFGFDPKNGKYKDFLSDYLFRGKTEYLEDTLVVRWLLNDKKDKFEFFIQLFPHTKKEHIIDQWDFIAREHARFPGYVGKNKKWETFDRDLYVYKIYKDLQGKLEKKRSPKNTPRIDEQTLSLAREKHPGLRLEQIKDIIGRVEKIYKEGFKDDF